MKRLGLAFPLRIRESKESVAVSGQIGVVAAYVYICDEPDRRQQTKRLSRADGIEIAKVIARALTAEAGPENE